MSAGHSNAALSVNGATQVNISPRSLPLAVGMIGVSTILARRGSVVEDNDEFAVAKRDFGIGLTAAGMSSVEISSSERAE